MIGFLSGIVKLKNKGSILILVNGVGYQVCVAPSTVTGDSADLFIHTHVREDCLDLYGFLTQDDLNMFEMLISVSGIGPKTAMLVMDRGSAAIRNAISNADTGFFTLIPRLGTKNAQKIIIELKNKIGGMTDLDLTSDTSEILDSLIGMGYKRTEAMAALKNLPPDLSVEEQIKYALKSLGKNKILG